MLHLPSHSACSCPCAYPEAPLALGERTAQCCQTCLLGSTTLPEWSSRYQHNTSILRACIVSPHNENCCLTGFLQTKAGADDVEYYSASCFHWILVVVFKVRASLLRGNPSSRKALHRIELSRTWKIPPQQQPYDSLSPKASALIDVLYL